VGLVLNGAEHLMTKETEKMEIINAFCVLVFAEKISFRNHRHLLPVG